MDPAGGENTEGWGVAGEKIREAGSSVTELLSFQGPPLSFLVARDARYELDA